MGLDELREARLLTDANLEQPEAYRTAAGQVVLSSQRAPGKETPNEDAALVLPLGSDGVLLAVADGAGGMPAGHIASRLTLETLLQSVQAVEPGDALRGAVLDGLERANEAILATRNGSGTTVAVAVIYAGRLRTFHVGDSQILVIGQRGKIKLQTIMHSPVGYALESELLDEAGAAVHEERYVVSNLLGTREMRIEIGPDLALAPRDTVLLASDGLADNLLSDAIVERIRMGPLQRGLSALARDCQVVMRGEANPAVAHPDDLTLIAHRGAVAPRPRPASSSTPAGQTESPRSGRGG
ncbi:MAG: serine/threonine-protein phosphatase [Planctomycetes bacterium]|nr:serine/threonine-protein phosphatase [Planctomycetota bacterium]